VVCERGEKREPDERVRARVDGGIIWSGTRLPLPALAEDEVEGDEGGRWAALVSALTVLAAAVAEWCEGDRGGDCNVRVGGLLVLWPLL